MIRSRYPFPVRSTACAHDPRSTASAEDLQQQFEFALGINRKLTETHRAITRLRKVRTDVVTLSSRAGEYPDSRVLEPAAEALTGKLAVSCVCCGFISANSARRFSDQTCRTVVR